MKSLLSPRQLYGAILALSLVFSDVMGAGPCLSRCLNHGPTLVEQQLHAALGFRFGIDLRLTLEDTIRADTLGSEGLDHGR
jgi:hypothetical protein